MAYDGDERQTKFNLMLDHRLLQEDLIPNLIQKRDEVNEVIRQQLKDASITDEVLKQSCANVFETKNTLKNHLAKLKYLLESDEMKELVSSIETFTTDNKINRLKIFDKFIKNVDNLPAFKETTESNIARKHFWLTYESIFEKRASFAELFKENIEEYLSDNASLLDDYNLVKKKVESDLDTQLDYFLFQLSQIFKRNIGFCSDEAGNATFSCNLLTEMTQEQFNDYIKCILKEKDSFKSYFHNCFDMINDQFIKPILMDNKTISILDLRIIKISQNEDSELAQLDNLKTFIGQVINLFTNDFKSIYSAELVGFIGELWTDHIMEYVVLYYYEPMMPKTESKLESFLASVQKGNDLLEFMVSIGMIADKAQSKVLNNYLSNIEDNFSIKLYQSALLKMKQILKSSISQIISSESILGKLSCQIDNQFSSCHVSDFMLQVKDLFEDVSEQLSNSSTSNNPLLIETFQNMCQLFVTITPFEFKSEIETSSMKNALFYTNCLLAAYLIECFVNKHKPILDSLLLFVPVIQNLGSQVFISQMKVQEKFILFFVRCDEFKNSLKIIAEEKPSTDLKVSSNSHFIFRNGINNSLKHVFALNQSFNDILPQKIYTKTFTTLINSLLSEFIMAILSLEDISALAASHLSHELDYFTKELQMFLDNSEQITAKWLKLNEINFILKSSLLEIVNRWADGKGLLAHYLTADEVKHLIQALFQNNERRANALLKIK